MLTQYQQIRLFDVKFDEMFGGAASKAIAFGADGKRRNCDELEFWGGT